MTALIHPMGQGVLETLKRKYKRKIIEELILRDEEVISIPHFLKSINMQVVSNLIAASWNEISSNIIQLSWRKVIPSMARETVLQTTESSENSTSSLTYEPDIPTSANVIEVQTLFRTKFKNRNLTVIAWHLLKLPTAIKLLMVLWGHPQNCCRDSSGRSWVCMTVIVVS